MTTPSPAAVRALIEKASPLPWRIDEDGSMLDANGDYCAGPDAEESTNALSCAAVNALPGLIDRIESDARRIGALEAFVRDMSELTATLDDRTVDRARSLLRTETKDE